MLWIIVNTSELQVVAMLIISDSVRTDAV